MFSCRAYHYWDNSSSFARQKLKKYTIGTPVSWGGSQATIGHQVVQRNVSGYDETQIYTWLSSTLCPHLLENVNVSNEEIALFLVANLNPLLDTTKTENWFLKRWSNSRLAGYLLLLAATREVLNQPELPEICLKHVKNWTTWIHRQKWECPSYLPVSLINDGFIKNADHDGLIELALAIAPYGNGPMLAPGTPAIMQSPIRDDLEVWANKDPSKWPSLRRVTWWMDDVNWVVRVAHSGPSDDGEQKLTGYGSIYSEDPTCAAQAWRTWMYSVAQKYSGKGSVTAVTLALGLLSMRLSEQKVAVMVPNVYSWWRETRSVHAQTLLSLLTNFSTDKVSKIVLSIDALQDVDRTIIKNAFDNKCSLPLPADLVEQY